jgi:hypothetical protein
MFRIALTAQPASFRIGHSDPLLLVGSCFTEHIGHRLVQHKFNTTINPYGIVYNPVSLARALDPMPLDLLHLVEHQGVWHHMDCHSALSSPDRPVVAARVTAAGAAVSEALKWASCILLTLGTAEVFEWQTTGQIIANCHKLPAAQFTNRRLSIQEVIDALQVPLSRLLEERPDVHIVLTVSPVRHLRRGMVEHQRSKATLVLACEALCQAIPQAHYFPAYELLMDDLRDYRFYADDMVHPSTMAIDYVWQHFVDTFFSPATQALNQQISKIMAAAAHRPFNPDTEAHRAFVERQLEAIELLERQHPSVHFNAEKTLLYGEKVRKV